MPSHPLSYRCFPPTTRRVSVLGAAVLAVGFVAGCATAPIPEAEQTWATLTGAKPLVIAHRGASGVLPEHTLAAYARAIEDGADVIEPDLVMTKDAILVARHDRFLSTTTDVASRPEFADRRGPDPTGDSDRTDWWVHDFTLDELKTLRAVQPYAGRSTDFDGQYQVPTFQEVIALAKAADRPVAIYPETKAPTAHANLGYDMENAMVAALTDAGWTGRDAPVFVQSFEPEILVALNARIETALVQLVYPEDPEAPVTNIPLETLAAYADGVGPNKLLVIDADGNPTDFVADAHALGLVVHPWTFRDDRAPADGASPEAELARAFATGVDGVFTDFPATAIAVRDAK